MKTHYAQGGLFFHRSGARFVARDRWPVCGFDMQLGSFEVGRVTCPRCLAFLAQWKWIGPVLPPFQPQVECV